MNKFNLYDFIAVIIPGIFFLWCLNIFLSVSSSSLKIPLEGDLTKVTILIVLGYITGLLLQGISQGVTEPILKFLWGGFPSEKLLLDDDKRLSTIYKSQFWEKINLKNKREKPASNLVNEKEKIKALKKENQECFYLAYRSIKSDETILTFNAQYGLFRCLLTTFTIVFLLSLFTFKDLQKANVLFPILILSAIGIIITYFRAKKRGVDFAKCVLDTFIASKNE